MNLTSLSRCLKAQMMARSCVISFPGNPVVLLAENPRFIRENTFQMNLEYAGCKTSDVGTRSHCQGNLYSYSVEQDHTGSEQQLSSVCHVTVKILFQQKKNRQKDKSERKLWVRSFVPFVSLDMDMYIFHSMNRGEVFDA